MGYTIGFRGCNLPTTKGVHSLVDNVKTIELLVKVMSDGVYFLESSPLYHGGNGEAAFGALLQNVPSEYYTIGTTLPYANCKEPNDFIDSLNKSVFNLKIDHLNRLTLPNLTLDTFKELLDMGLWEFFSLCKTNNKIDSVGFSFNGNLEEFKAINEIMQFNFVQLDINLLSSNLENTLEIIKYAKKKNMSVVAYNLLDSGNLHKDIPADISDALLKSGVIRMPVESALGFIFAIEGIDFFLLDFNNIEDASALLKLAKNIEKNPLTKEDFDALRAINTQFAK